MKKSLFLALAVFLTVTPALSSVRYCATSLTGGGAGALDAIDGSDPNGDGNNADALTTGDSAIVTTSSTVYVYYLNGLSGAAESSPSIIAPDSSPGNKRWILLTTYSSHAASHITSGADELDADQADIDWNPTTYVPATDALAPSVDNLTAHLKGVDNSIAALSGPLTPGLAIRGQFTYSSGTAVVIDAGVYHHQGTKEQLVY
jgi:hypothetical protein